MSGLIISSLHINRKQGSRSLIPVILLWLEEKTWGNDSIPWLSVHVFYLANVGRELSPPFADNVCWSNHIIHESTPLPPDTVIPAVSEGTRSWKFLERCYFSVAAPSAPSSFHLQRWRFISKMKYPTTHRPQKWLSGSLSVRPYAHVYTHACECVCARSICLNAPYPGFTKSSLNHTWHIKGW